MQSDRIVGLSLFVIGLVVLFAGMEASHSISSDFSKLFQGAPSDKAIWLMLGGAIIGVIGLVKTLRSRPENG